MQVRMSAIFRRPLSLGRVVYTAPQSQGMAPDIPKSAPALPQPKGLNHWQAKE